MPLIAWIISIGAFLGALGLRADMAFVHADALGLGLFMASILACPFFWNNALARGFMTGRMRVMAGLALVLALPLLLLPA